MISKDDYLNFIDKLTEKYSKRFGDVWWCSLISEKNPSKSLVYHNLVKGNIPNDKYIAIKSVVKGLKKYLSFIVRKVIFGNKYYHGDPETIFITYNKEFMFPFTEEDGLHIFMPQKNQWRKYKDKLVIDHFVSMFELNFILSFRYLKEILKNIIPTFLLYRDISNSFFPYKIFKGDIWRSFAGDVLVEGLFYEIVFSNIKKRFTKLEKIIYPYEGQAWEKALCSKFDMQSVKRIGILCSTPSDNTLNFWYSEKEIELGLPVPDYLGVFGNNLKDRFNIYKHLEYLNNPMTFVIGPMRFRNIEKLLADGKESIIIYDILVVMPSNERMALELFDYILQKYKGTSKDKVNKIAIKPHPDNRFDLFKTEGNMMIAYGGEMEDLITKSKIVISVDSSAEFMALALGKQIISPTLPSFIGLSPVNSGFSTYNRKYIKDYFDFSKDEREELNRVGK